jgi:hypothetical protein
MRGTYRASTEVAVLEEKRHERWRRSARGARDGSGGRRRGDCRRGVVGAAEAQSGVHAPAAGRSCAACARARKAQEQGKWMQGWRFAKLERCYARQRAYLRDLPPASGGGGNYQARTLEIDARRIRTSTAALLRAVLMRAMECVRGDVCKIAGSRLANT